MCPKRRGREGGWKAADEEGDIPVPARAARAPRSLSTAGHEKSGRNLRGPSRKAKYSRKTDSA